MAINYATALKNQRLMMVTTALDAGTGPGKIEIGTAGMATVLVSIELAKPSASATNGIWSLLDTPRSGVASNTGTAAAARLRDSDNNDVATGLTVGAGQDIVLDSDNIIAGQTVRITSGQIVHA